MGGLAGSLPIVSPCGRRQHGGVADSWAEYREHAARTLRRARELVAESEALRQPLYASPESPTAPSRARTGAMQQSWAIIVGSRRRSQ
jgi:hypothetical protein